MSRLSAEIRPDERRSAAGAFLALFGILAAHTLLETARDALFLARLAPSQLPWVYLAMAAVAVLVAEAPARFPRRLTGAASLSLLLAVSAVVTLAFWTLGPSSSAWMLRALYVWSGLFGTLAALEFWLTLGELYTITQAKRLYRFIGLGSLLGAVAGAGAARTLSLRLDAEDLVLAAGVTMALCAAVPIVLLRSRQAHAEQRPAGASVLEAVSLLRGQPYVARLAGLVLVSTVALTLADYIFKSAVARNVAPAELGAFFATVYMALNVAALAVQLFLMGWLLRSVGLHRALWALPALVFLGAAGVAFGGGLLAALVLKAADGSLRHSLHRTSTELLYLPIPDSLRSRAKPLIDVVGQRGGQALASVFILGELTLQRGETLLAAAAALLCIVWVAWAADLRPHYIELFRSALRQGTIHRDAEAPPLDLGALEALFGALNSRDDAEVVGALELLAAEGRERLIPALVLYHPSRDVVLRALEIFAGSGRSDFVPIADRLLDSPDAELRAEALRARSQADPDARVLCGATLDESPLVRATALAGLVSGGWVTDAAQSTLDELRRDGSPEKRRALARAIQRQPAEAFEDVLLELAASADPGVLAPVAQAMAARPSPRFLRPLLPLLVPPDVRDAARGAFVAIGGEALEFLDAAMADDSLPLAIRRHLPRTISRFQPAAAAAVLLRRLVAEQDGVVRFKILRGLGRIAHDHPDVPLDRRVLRQGTEATLETCFRLVDWRLTLERGAASVPSRVTPGHELLSALLLDKQEHAIERLFRLLALQHPREDFQRVYRGLRNREPKVRASSRELLEAALEPPLRDAVLGLLDDVPASRRLASAGPFYQVSPLDYEALLARLLQQPSETVRCLAAYHVGELGLTRLREPLQAIATRDASSFVAQVIERALSLLARPEERRLLFAD
jgi:ATP/ADP translocase